MKTIILAIAMTLTATTGGENITITLCDQAKTGRIFEIKDTLECKKSKVEKIEKCWGDIYDPNIKRIPITAYKCTKMVDTYKSYWYFLGYKKHTMLGTATRGVSPQECRRWASLKQATGIGKLRSTEADIFKTNKPIEIEYRYIQEFFGEIQNAVMQRINITIDLTTGQVTNEDSGCNGQAVEARQCQNAQSTTVWDHPKEKICKDVRATKLGKTTQIKILHDQAGRKTLKAEGLKLYLTERTETPRHIKACKLKGEVISTVNGLQIVLRNCSAKGAKEEIKAGMQIGKPSEEAGKDYRYITHYMDFMENNLVNLIWENLQHEEFWECQERKKQLKILKALAKLDPTTAVRAMARSKTFAIWSKGTIKEILCRNTTARLEKSMKLPGGLIAGAPLATILEGNKTTKIQWKNDFWWEKKISFSKNSNKSRKQTFKINGKWREFSDGDLQPGEVKATMLTNSADHFKMDYTASNFAESARLEGSVQQDWNEKRHWEEIGAIINGRTGLQESSYNTESDNLKAWIEEKEIKVVETPWILSILSSILKSMGGTGIIVVALGLWWLSRRKKGNQSPEKRYQAEARKGSNMQQFQAPRAPLSISEQGFKKSVQMLPILVATSPEQVIQNTRQ